MKALDIPLSQLLEGPKQFIIPIFQRTYSWGTKHCEQLLKDILLVGENKNRHAHFLGSVVYITDDVHTAAIPRWQIIDGQQRLATITLFLLALYKTMQEHPITLPNVTVEEIEDYYLKNRHGRNDLKYKLLLTQRDKDTMIALLRGTDPGMQASVSIMDNYKYFLDYLKEINLAHAYDGFKKLMIVDVSLTRGQDDPQMIFESLNSTGLDLSQADLIRNFVFMRQSPDEQTRLYLEIWYPMEQLFGILFIKTFDYFVRDYLTLMTKPTTPIHQNEIYQEYKRLFQMKEGQGKTVKSIIADLYKYTKYYCCFYLGKEHDSDLQEAFVNLRQLIEVASPFIMRLYKLYEDERLTKKDFIEAVKLAESYVFRRSVCDMQTRSLGQIFATLTYAINEENPLESIKVTFARFTKNRRFPSDAEFRESLLSRDIYSLRNRRFLLNRLENDSEEKIDTSNFTIEHVMPQNPKLSPDWKTALGDSWEKVHETYLHKLGNLTLTGYNQRYSDESFNNKKTMEGGFNDSPLRLNRFLREQDTWNETLMIERGNILAEHAVKLWRSLEVDEVIVQRYALEERRAGARNLTLDNVEALRGGPVRKLFDILQIRIKALSDDVTEILDRRNVTYYVFEYFAQVIPRTHNLTVLLNLDFIEVSDDSEICRDATIQSFITNSTVKGGVFLQIYSETDIDKAMLFIRQTYENAIG
ncbi:MAG: DUF262 domain-containing protein [candidate division Zixibacteria bacterium]|nr:DUF262 domain-containing protein [Candidatus Tariuqbacter arcticus]